MKTELKLNHLIVLLVVSMILLIGATLFPATAAAQTTSSNPVNATKNVQLAYWYGGYYHRHYYNPYWTGYNGYGYRYICPRHCWRGYYGYWHCTRRC